jgi:hypothetical protein
MPSMPSRDILDGIRLTPWPWISILSLAQFASEHWIFRLLQLLRTFTSTVALRYLACRSPWCRSLQPLSAWDILYRLRSGWCLVHGPITTRAGGTSVRLKLIFHASGITASSHIPWWTDQLYIILGELYLIYSSMLVFCFGPGRVVQLSAHWALPHSALVPEVLGSNQAFSPTHKAGLRSLPVKRFEWR